MAEIQAMEVPELNLMINARLKKLERRSKAEEQARKMEKDMKRSR